MNVPDPHHEEDEEYDDQCLDYDACDNDTCTFGVFSGTCVTCHGEEVCQARDGEDDEGTWRGKEKLGCLYREN